jgi:hypothetical protein
LGRGQLVVIPWRGLRCFTQNIEFYGERIGGVWEVVIPWRGFRCFTPDEQLANAEEFVQTL